MVKHLVAWRISGSTPEEKNLQYLKMKNSLETLVGQIPGLLRLEVGLDFSRTNNSSDVLLYTEFVSRQALTDYAIHPAHLKAVDEIRDLISERRVIDFESPG